MKLNKSQILQLPSGRTNRHVRLTRLYWPKAIIEFDGEAEVYIARREKTYKKLLVGEIIGITAGDCWAEGTEKDIMDDGSIIVEDYQMEIFDDN